MTISEWLKHARERLTETGCPDPDIDARWIAEEGLGMSRQDLVFEGDGAVPRDRLYQLESMLDRRAAGEPETDFRRTVLDIESRLLLIRILDLGTNPARVGKSRIIDAVRREQRNSLIPGGQPPLGTAVDGGKVQRRLAGEQFPVPQETPAPGRAVGIAGV